MSSDDIDEAYWKDEEENDEEVCKSAMRYEKLGLEWPGGPFISPVRFYVEGDLGGDIKWNNIDARITLSIPFSESQRKKYEQNKSRYGDAAMYYSIISCGIRPFTHNCGIKTIESISGNLSKAEGSFFLKYVESFLWHKCNVGILLGSDSIENPIYRGHTGHCIDEWGSGYTCLPSVWNPNYTWANEHQIYLFYKNLGDHVHTDYWG